MSSSSPPLSRLPFPCCQPDLTVAMASSAVDGASATTSSVVDANVTSFSSAVDAVDADAATTIVSGSALSVLPSCRLNPALSSRALLAASPHHEDHPRRPLPHRPRARGRGRRPPSQARPQHRRQAHGLTLTLGISVFLIT